MKSRIHSIRRMNWMEYKMKAFHRWIMWRGVKRVSNNYNTRMHGKTSETSISRSYDYFLLEQENTFLKQEGGTSLSYPKHKFFGLMVDNGTAESLCSISQLRAHRMFTGNHSILSNLKDHCMVSAHGGSKCISQVIFIFLCKDSVVLFHALIVDKMDYPLILILSDMGKFAHVGRTNR